MRTTNFDSRFSSVHERADIVGKYKRIANSADDIVVVAHWRLSIDASFSRKKRITYVSRYEG